MIENLKDLKALLKLCRQNGVSEITVNGATLKLGEMPTKHPAEELEDQEDVVLQGFPDGELTAEELTFFANGGRPEDNPYRKLNEN